MEVTAILNLVAAILEFFAIYLQWYGLVPINNRIKFGKNRTFCWNVTSIFAKSKMATAAVMDLLQRCLQDNVEFLVLFPKYPSNLVKIWPSVCLLHRFFINPRWRRPPSWILMQRFFSRLHVSSLYYFQQTHQIWLKSVCSFHSYSQKSKFNN